MNKSYYDETSTAMGEYEKKREALLSKTVKPHRRGKREVKQFTNVQTKRFNRRYVIQSPTAECKGRYPVRRVEKQSHSIAGFGCMSSDALELRMLRAAMEPDTYREKVGSVAHRMAVESRSGEVVGRLVSRFIKRGVLLGGDQIYHFQEVYHCLENKRLRGRLVETRTQMFDRVYVRYKWERRPDMSGFASVHELSVVLSDDEPTNREPCKTVVHHSCTLPPVSVHANPFFMLLTFKKGCPSNSRMEEEKSLAIYTKSYANLKTDVERDLSRAVSGVRVNDPRAMAKEMRRVVTLAVRAESMLRRSETISRQRQRDVKSAKLELRSYTAMFGAVGVAAAVAYGERRLRHTIASLSTMTQATVELVVHLASFIYGFTAELSANVAVHFASFLIKLKDYFFKVAPPAWSSDWDSLHSAIVSSLRKSVEKIVAPGQAELRSGLKATVDVLDFLRKNYTRVVESDLVKIFKTTVKYVMCVLYGSIAGVKTWAAAAGGITFWRIDYSTVDITDLGKFILDTLHYLGDRLDKLVDLRDTGKLENTEEVMSAMFDPNPDLQKLGVEHVELSYLVSQYSVLSCEEWVALVNGSELQACHAMILGRLTKLINAITALSASKKTDTYHVSACINLLRAAQATYSSATFNNSKASLRKAPFSLYISGPTGVGKSTLTPEVIKALLTDHMPVGQAVEPVLVGKLTDQNFDNDLDSKHLAVVVDDVFQSAIAETNQAMAMKIFQLQNNMTSTLNRAAIEEKGRTVCNPLLIVATANAERVPKGVVQCTRALARRFHYYLRISVLSDFKDASGMVDSKKIDALSDEEIQLGQFYACRIEEVSLLQASNGSGEDYKFRRAFPLYGDASLPDCLNFLNVKMKAHLERQSNLLRKLNNPNYGLCLHGKHRWTCSVCIAVAPPHEIILPRRAETQDEIFRRHFEFHLAGPSLEGETEHDRKVRCHGRAYNDTENELQAFKRAADAAALENLVGGDDDSDSEEDVESESKDEASEGSVDQNNAASFATHAFKLRRPVPKRMKRAHAKHLRMAKETLEQFVLDQEDQFALGDGGLLVDADLVEAIDAISHPLGVPFQRPVAPSIVKRTYSYLHGRWKAFVSGEDFMLRRAVSAFVMAGAAGALYYSLKGRHDKKEEAVQKIGSSATGLDKVKDGVLLHTLERYLEPTLFSSTDKASNVCISDFENGLRAMMVTLTVKVNDGGHVVIHGVNGGYVLPGTSGVMHVYTSAHFELNVHGGVLEVDCAQFATPLVFACNRLSSVDLGADTRRIELRGPSVRQLAYYFAPASRVWRNTLIGADLRHIGRALVTIGLDEEVRGHSIELASRDEGIVAIRHALAHYTSLDQSPPLASDIIVTKGGVWTRPLRTGDCGGLLYANIAGVCGGSAVLGAYIARFTDPVGREYNLYTKNPDYSVRLMTSVLRDALYVDNVSLLRAGARCKFQLGNFAKVAKTLTANGIVMHPTVREDGKVIAYSLNRLTCFGAPQGNPIPVQSFATSVHRRPGFLLNEELLGLTDHKAPSVGKGVGQATVPECNMKAVRALAHNGMVTFNDRGVQTFAGEDVHFSVPVVVKREMLEKAAVGVRDMVVSVLRCCSNVESLLSPLPAHNVLCGIRESIPHLNRRSSAGFSGEEKVGRIGDEIDGVFAFDGSKYHYREHVEPILVDMETRALCGDLEYVARVLLKHEPVGVSKQYARTFYASPLVWQILLRRRLGKLYTVLTADPLRCELSVGIDPVSADWETLCAHLRIGDETWSKFGGDFGSFDLMAPAELLNMVVKAIFDACEVAGVNVGDVGLCSAIMKAVVNPTYIILGEVYKMNGSHPSGYLWTVLVNGFMVSTLLRQLFYERADELGHNLRFEDHVKVVTGGDDHVVAVSSVAREYGLIDACMFGKLVRSYGWNYTDPNKLPYSVPFTDESSIDFLKRAFGVFAGRPCGLLAKKSVKKTLMWGIDSKEVKNQVLSGVVRSVMREALVHGEEYFQLILQACRNVVYSLPEAEIVTGKHLVENVYEGRYQALVDELVQSKFVRPCARFSQHNDLELRGRIDELLSQLPVHCDEGALHGADVFTSSDSRAFSSNGGEGLTELHSLRFSVTDTKQPNMLSGVAESKEVDTSKVVDMVAQEYEVRDDVYGVLGAVEVPANIPNREFYVGEWEVALDGGFAGLNVDIPAAWRQSLINTLLHVPFKYIMEVEARIVVTAHQYHAGLLCAYMHPCPGEDPLFVRPADPITFYDKSVAFQYPHVEIDLCKSGEYVVKCRPIVNQLSRLPSDLTSLDWKEGGTLHIVPITEVYDASSSTTPVPPRIAVFGRVTRAVFEGKTELNTYTPVGERLATFAKARFGTSGVTSAALDAVGGAISRALGFSMPGDNSPVPVVSTSRAYGVTDGFEVGIPSAASLADGRQKPVDTVPVGDMEINAITSKEGLLGIFNLERDVKDLQVQFAVQPYAAQADGNVYTHTPLGYVSLIFRRWRGSLKYRFKVVAPSSAVGIVSIVVDPLVGPAVRRPRPDRRTTYDIDLSAKREIEVCVPWHNVNHVLETLPNFFGSSYVSSSQYMDAIDSGLSHQIPLEQSYYESNGVITVMTTTPITYPFVGTTLPNSYVVVTVSSDDVEFFDPYMQVAGGFGMQLNSLVVAPDDTTVVGCDGKKGHLTVPERLGLEKVVSCKQLIMRYMMHCVNNYTATTPSGTNQEVAVYNCWPRDGLPYGVVESTNGWYEWFIDDGGTASRKPGCLAHFLHWFRPLYYCSTGGMKFRAGVSGQSSFPSSITGRWFGVGSSHGTVTTIDSRIRYAWSTNGGTALYDMDMDVNCGTGARAAKGSFEPHGSTGIVAGYDGGQATGYFPDRSGLPFRYARQAHLIGTNSHYQKNPYDLVASAFKYRPGVAGGSVTYTRERVHMACAEDYALGCFACVPRLYAGPYGLSS